MAGLNLSFFRTNKSTRIGYVYTLAFVLFVVLVFILPDSFIPPETGNTILTISTFLFGILTGFYVVITTTDYNSVKSLAALEAASLISLYQNVDIYDKKSTKKLFPAVDEYVRRSFDYTFIEYPKATTQNFEAIRKASQEVPFIEKKGDIFQCIRGSLDQFIAIREQLMSFATKSLSGFQWVVVVALSLIVISALYGLRSGGLFFDLVTVLISSSIVLILVLIRDLDIYVWHSQTFGYEVYQNVFRAIGELPYYPSDTVEEGILEITDEKYRYGVLLDQKTWKRKIEIRKR